MSIFCSSREWPINDQSTANEYWIAANSRAFHTHVGVAPAFEFFAARYIAVGYIHAADVADSAVDYSEFTVVAPVYACGERWKYNLEKWVDIDSGVKKAFEEASFHAPASEIVVDYSYFHSFGSFPYKSVGQTIAYFIVLNNVILEIDVALRPLYIIEQRLEFVFAVMEYPYRVVGVEHGSAKRAAKVNQLAYFLREVVRYARVYFCFAFAKLTLVASRNHVGVFDTSPEKDIENQTADREKQQHRNPT